MSKRIFKLLLVAALCANLIIGWWVAAKAQVAVATSTATPSGPAVTGSPTSATSVRTSSDPNAVTFTQLRQGEIQLLGPYEETVFSFFMPSDWKLLPGAALHVSAGVSFNTVVQNQSSSVVTGGGGTLTATLNGNALGVLSLDKVGEVDWNVPIDPNAFSSSSSDGSMVVTFILSSGINCLADQHMNIFIHPSSYLTLPHTFVHPNTSLINFPHPIYQNSFSIDSTLLVVPDHPSPAELQAALTVAAGLGNLTSNGVILDMTTLGKFKPDQAAYIQATTNHLIFVGKPSSLSLLSALNLPSPVQGGKFQSSGGSQDDGYVQMVESPWSNSHVVLVVTGNTDAGIVKAAQAVSTGLLRPNRFPNLAVIQEVQSAPVAAPQAVDLTLADLGSNGRNFSGRGSKGVSYTFNVSPGQTVAADAYFELVYGHSALLDYDRSAITITLNNRPIGSVRMTDETASHATNLARFALPASAVQPGKNRLVVAVTMIPIDDCTPPGAQVIWISLWPQSRLHLPLAGVSVNPAISQVNLASYPGPFAYDPLLSSTAFVLAHDDLVSWRAAAQIAEYLGYQAGGPLMELSAFYGNEVPAADRAKDHLLVIGRPSQIPLVSEMNKSLPAPFSGGADVASESNFQVTYRIPPDSPLGYLETMASPWNPSRVVLAVLGNEEQGVSWATAAVIDPALRSRLAGNFAAVNAGQVVTTDTLAAFAAGSLPPTANVPVLPPFAANAPAQPVSRPDWVLPVLVITSLLVVLMVVWALVRSTARGRGGRPGADNP